MFGAAFSLLELGLRFLVGVALGVAIGLLAGYLVAAVRRRIENPLVEITSPSSPATRHTCRPRS
jgi:CPA1 family monovalent cation:H+ antiporter